MPYKYRDYARISAEAACFAWKEGKFSEMYELLLRKSPSLDMESLLSYGKMLGLNTERMKEEIEGQKCGEIIERDLKEARELNIYATPAFIVGRKRIIGAPEYDFLKKAIEEELGGVSN